jgi:hypothetical protein
VKPASRDAARDYRGKGVRHLSEDNLEKLGHVIGIEQRYVAHQLSFVLVRHV